MHTNFLSAAGKRKCRIAWIQALLVLVCILVILLEEAEAGRKQAKPGRRIKKSRAGVGKDFSEFLLVIGVVMTCVIAPVFLFFLHSLYKDPAVPELARECWKAVKVKFFSYLGGRQSVAVPDSTTSHGIVENSPLTPRDSRRRSIGTSDDNNFVRRNREAPTTNESSWSSRKGAAGASMPPPARRTFSTDRSYPVPSARDKPHHRYVEDEGDTDEGASDGRRLYRQKHEERDWRPGRATMAPFSSGALRSPWKSGRGVEPRGAGSHDVARAELSAARRRSPTGRRREGFSRRSPAQRAEFLGDEIGYLSGLRHGREWDPYPDEIGDFDDEGEEPGRRSGRGSKLEGAQGMYKDAQGRRRASKTRRTRMG